MLFGWLTQPRNALGERHLCLSAPEIDQGSGECDATGDRHFGRRAARADGTLKQDSTAKHCSGRSYLAVQSCKCTRN
jgi:hypothetical protein